MVTSDRLAGLNIVDMSNVCSSNSRSNVQSIPVKDLPAEARTRLKTKCFLGCEYLYGVHVRLVTTAEMEQQIKCPGLSLCSLQTRQQMKYLPHNHTPYTLAH